MNNIKKPIKVKHLYYIISLTLSLFITNINAQQGWEIGGWLGSSFYFGDLNTDFDLSHPGLAAGAVARYNFNNRLCLKFGANYGNVSATDIDADNPFERARNLHFKSTIFDGTFQFEFNFLPYVHGSTDQFFTPYIFAGASIFYFNPKTEYEGTWYELRPLGTEGQFRGEEYYTVQGGFAFGAGFKYALNYEWSIDLEISARNLFSDYLDDVSTTYPDSRDLASLRGDLAASLSDRSIELTNLPNIGGAGRQRGDSNNNDSYAFVSIGLLYYFGSIKCPTITK